MSSLPRHLILRLRMVRQALAIQKVATAILSALLVYVLAAMALGQNSGGAPLSHGISSQSAAYSQSRESETKRVTVTRWVSSEGKLPITYAEWKAQVGDRGPFLIESVDAAQTLRSPNDATKFCIIINASLYPQIETSLGYYIIQLTGEGYDVEVYATSGGTPDDLRTFMQGRYAAGMEGCVLIGDLPVAWYETHECWDPPEHEEFPCDLFYMDMDGVFADADFDGLYDSHTGNGAPEIWVGRLTASPLNEDGADEVSLLQNYFAKNRHYRSELEPLNNRALVYVEDDWAGSGSWWSDNVGLAYPDRTLVNDEWTTWDTDYESRLPQNYEFIQICAHSSPGEHYFYNPGGGSSQTFNWEVKLINPVAYFYNLFACSNARFVTSNYMAGWYVFCETYGLAAVGSTKTGSMLEFDFFYQPFGERKTIGEAFRDWFVSVGSYGYMDTCWYYGMTLIGDPTLRMRPDPLEPGVFVTPVALPNGEVDAPYYEELEVTGGIPPYSWEIAAGSLPDGLGIGPTDGIIQGTPALTGTGLSVFTVQVADSDNPPQTDIQHLTIDVPYCVDTDGDGTGDPGHPANTCPTDNCPSVYNPDQEDVDGDGIGDSCEVIRTWYVQVNGMGDAPSIQAAIDSCTHGDTVMLAGGVYTGVGNTELNLRGRRILLLSEYGPLLTVIDAQGSVPEPRRGFTFQNDVDSQTIIEGLTIRGGYGSLWQGTSCGGGMFFDNSSPTIKNCIFAGNSAQIGGAIFVNQCSPQLINCTFVDNTAMHGSAVLARNSAAPVIANSVLAFNTDGEAVSCFSSGTTALSCSDVFGNSGGDWVGCIAGQDGLNGNFSSDPAFCDLGAGSYGLQDGSPCLPPNNVCECLIGAVDVGCTCHCGIWGDVTGDGNINPVDVVFMVNAVYLSINILVPYLNCPYDVGDVNCDGNVNPVDVVYFVNRVYLTNNMFCPDPCGE